MSQGYPEVHPSPIPSPNSGLVQSGVPVTVLVKWTVLSFGCSTYHTSPKLQCLKNLRHQTENHEKKRKNKTSEFPKPPGLSQTVQFLFLAGDRNQHIRLISAQEWNLSWLSLLYDLLMDYRAAWSKLRRWLVIINLPHTVTHTHTHKKTLHLT